MHNMDISKVAQNLYKKHLGRYLIYELEGHKVRFRYKGKYGTYKISQVKRDVFANKIYFTSANGKIFDFREPSYILNENEKTVFVYLDTSLKDDNPDTPLEIGSKIEFTIIKKDIPSTNLPIVESVS